MKIHIIFDIKPGPYGGGNQFLKCLKSWLESQSCYAKTPEDADLFLFNSHQHTLEVARIKRLYPKKPFIHRIDGPMRLYNKMSDRRDHVVNITNSLIADVTIFQSIWSQKKNLELGLLPTSFERVIHNASDPKIFNTLGKPPFHSWEKIRLIATSWSPSKNKGFDTYHWLDENLNFDRYEMCFVGRSSIKFKNINLIPPLNSHGVAQKLRESDIYITASQKEPCSNSLIEALSCGLPIVALNDGGHPELTGVSGELFDDARDIPRLLNKIVENPLNYLNQPPLLSIAETGKKYCDLAKQVTDTVKINNYSPKKLNFWGYIMLIYTLLSYKLISYALHEEPIVVTSNIK
jgi:glycosyltransferase involved in cell wall biosynthesis|tara:strand:- start:46 stop:1089 length:1044 start_codon:yes stop_codon:yes gene_type:complete